MGLADHKLADAIAYQAQMRPKDMPPPLSTATDRLDTLRRVFLAEQARRALAELG